MLEYQPPADLGLDILYQDTDLIAVNKPSGLLAVPGKGEYQQDSLSARVQQRFGNALVVHRLDMATSGIMLLALNKSCQRSLSEQFRERQIEKHYLARVAGKLKATSGSIDLPLIADWPNRPKQKVDHHRGKPSLTHYELIEYETATDISRVQLTPVTGRSHQLRVHMLTIGHVIVGDQLYADSQWKQAANRLQLHAEHLRLFHPVTDQPIDISSPAPF